MKFKIITKLSLFLLALCLGRNTFAVPVLQRSDFKGNITNVKNVAMGANEVATLTWIFSEAVEHFYSFSVKDMTINLSPHPVDSSNKSVWEAKVNVNMGREFGTVNSFQFDGTSGGMGLGAFDELVPFSPWYVTDVEPYVSSSPLDGNAAWVRVDRYPVYAHWGADFKSISFDPQPLTFFMELDRILTVSNFISDAGASESVFPVNAKAPRYSFYVGNYLISIVPGLISSGGSEVASTFQAGFNGSALTVVPNGIVAPHYQVQVFDVSTGMAVAVTGRIELAPTSDQQSAFVLNVPSTSADAITITQHDFSSGTVVDISSGMISAAQDINSTVSLVNVFPLKKTCSTGVPS